VREGEVMELVDFFARWVGGVEVGGGGLERE